MSIKQHTDKKLCHRKHIARVLCLKIPLFVSSKISARVGEWSTLKNFPHIQFEHRGYSFPYCVACAHVGVPVNSGDAGAPPLRKREWWLLPTYPSTCFTVPNFFALDQSGFRNYGNIEAHHEIVATHWNMFISVCFAVPNLVVIGQTIWV